MRKIRIVSLVVMLSMFLAPVQGAFAHDWKGIAEDLIRHYEGKVLSIEQLNGSTCWAILGPDFSDQEAARMARDIGYFIKNATGRTKGETPVVHVFVNKRQVAIAMSTGRWYVGKIHIENWHPAFFKGKYRP
jgi:hypothetical protein